MSGAKGPKPDTGLPAGGFLTLILAQTCVSNYFAKRNGQITNIFKIILLKEGPYMYIFLQSILRMTAWPMTPPVPYSAFHILLTLFGAGLAFSFARVFGKKIRSMASPEPYFRHILFSCGVFLALMELYKQAFLYAIEFHGHFDWWYFPFQLCSVPMYICLAAPLLHSEKHFAAPPPSFRISVFLAGSWPWLYRQDSCIRTGR